MESLWSTAPAELANSDTDSAMCLSHLGSPTLSSLQTSSENHYAELSESKQLRDNDNKSVILKHIF